MGFRTQRIRKRSIRLIKEFYKAIKIDEKLYNSKTPLIIFFSVKDKKKIDDIYDRVDFLRWWYPKLVADFDYEKESFWIKLHSEFISTVEHNWRQEKWIKKPY